MNKRKLLKTAAISSIWTPPIITSVITPAHAQATALCIGQVSFLQPGQFDFIVPACATQLSVEVAGASGGNVETDRRFHRGGSGAVINDVINVNPGELLTIFVAEQGESTDGSVATPGGFGHGRGGRGGDTQGALFGTGGGGSSAIVRNGQPIIIAGGGGGSGGASNAPNVSGGNAAFSGNFGGVAGGRPGSNGLGGAGGINRNVPDPGEDGGSTDGGDGASPVRENFSAGGGGGGGFGGGGGGGRLGGGGGGGNLAGSRASISPTNIGKGRVVIRFL